MRTNFQWHKWLLLGSLLFWGGILLLWSALPVASQSAPYAALQTRVFTPAADSYVASGRPEQSRGDQDLWVGRDSNGGFGIQRTLMRFTVADGIPAGSTITSAALILNLDFASRGDGDMSVSAQRIGNK